MKKLLVVLFLASNALAMTCSNDSGFSIEIDDNGAGQLTTPFEVVDLQDVQGSDTYFYSKFQQGSLRSFSLDTDRGNLTIVSKRTPPVAQIKVSCK